MTFAVGAAFGWAVVKLSDWARGRWGWGWLYVQAVEHGRRLEDIAHRAELTALRSRIVEIDPSMVSRIAASEGASVAGAGT